MKKSRSKKRILIINSGWEQEPLLKRAREMDLSVIATNGYPNAEGFKHADKTFIADPRDLVKLEKIFQETKPDAVIADQCDYSMYAVAFLASRYGLPGPKMDSLAVTTNKYLERVYAAKAGVPQPEFKLCMTYSETVKAADSIGYPVMLKPLDNRGSIGVCRVMRPRDLRESYYETIANSHSRQMLVEKCVPGSVVTIDGLFTDRFYNLSFSTKIMHPKYPDNAMHLQFPGDLPDRIVERLYSYTQRLVKEIGIDFGATHTEFIIDGDDIRLLEIANRGGGVYISNKIMPAITGIDTCEALISGSLGRRSPLGKFPSYKESRVAFLHFFDFGSGKILSIKNVREAEALKGVLACKLFCKAGSVLGDIRTAVHRPGFVIVAGDTAEDCKAKLKEVYDTIKIKLGKIKTRRG